MSQEVELVALRATLTALLKRDGFTQQAIAASCGVDQGMISRIKSGKAKRFTEHAARLQEYVNMQLSGQLPEPIVLAVRSYLAAGYDPVLLCEQIRILCRAAAAGPRHEDRASSPLTNG